MATVSQTPVLELSKLAVSYGRHAAVSGLDVLVHRGEIVVMVGANGAGKSSTLNSAVGLVKPAGGDVLLVGRSVVGKPPHRNAQRGLVLVPEGRRIVSPLTVEENLLLGGFANSSKELRQSLLADILKMFPVLAERRTQPGGLLSGGEQQMLAFGRALMSNPKVLLLDEPSMGLAPVMVDRIFEAILAIKERGIAVLMAEQNASAIDLADTVYVVQQGEVTLSGPAAQVKGDPQFLSAVLGMKEDEPSRQ